MEQVSQIGMDTSKHIFLALRVNAAEKPLLRKKFRRTEMGGILREACTDGEAICEAAQRPTMGFVAVKSEAAQANAVVFRALDLLECQRTQAINALRGRLAEYGLIVAKVRGDDYHVRRT